MIISEVPARSRGLIYDYKRSSCQVSWAYLWLLAKLLPDLMGFLMIISEVPVRSRGLPYDYLRRSSKISWAYLWLLAKLLPDLMGFLMITSDVLLLLAMSVADLGFRIQNTASCHKDRNPQQVFAFCTFETPELWGVQGSISATAYVRTV